MSTPSKKWGSLLVADLKKELQQRGLSVAGKKAELVARLEEAETTNQIDKPKTSAEKPKESPKTDEAEIDIATEDLTLEEKKEQNGKDEQELTEEEKKKRRAGRFGITLVTSDSEKNRQRAERFGLPINNKSHNPLAAEKQQQRAQRFGLPIKSKGASSLTSPLDANRLKQRQERFGLDTTTFQTKSKNLTWNAEEEQKKRKRAERFATQEKKQKLAT